VQGPLTPKSADALLSETQKSGNAVLNADASASNWRTLLGAGADGRIRLESGKVTPDANTWILYSELLLESASDVQFLSGTNRPLKIWLNGHPLHDSPFTQILTPDSDRFDGKLAKGITRVVVQVALSKGQAEFHPRFRRKSSTANHEALMQA